MKYIILILLAVLQVVLVLVLSFKKHSSASRMFMTIVSSIAVWTVINASLDFFQYQDHASIQTLSVLNKLGFFMGCISILFAYRLSLVFPIEKVKSLASKCITLAALVFCVLSLNSVVSGSFFLPKDKTIAEYVYGSNAYLMGLYALLVIGLCVYNFAKGYKRSNPGARRQAVTIFSGLLLCILFGVIFIIAIPALTSSESFIFVGYYAPFVFTGSIIYSIVRQRLFDFRLIVARSVSYVLSVFAIAATYGFLTFSITNSLLFRGSNVTGLQKAIYTTLAVFVAFSFQPIQKLFNKITNELFYRDAYDTQVILDEIGKIIVGSIDLHKIEKSSLEVLAGAIRPTYMGFVLRFGNSKVRGQDFVGTSPTINSEDLLRIISASGKKQTHYDELEQSSDLAKNMRLADISLITPLITKNETVGYLLAGSKKSGNVFSEQDKRVLTIVANELAVALQNAQRFEEIQAFNITLQEKVNEATRELKSTNKKLVELDEAKDEFISMASHQLRTPLTSIKGYLSMILDGDMGKLSKGQASALKEAFGSSQRMVFLISDFLNVSRIKTGKFVIVKSEVNLASMVQEELAQLKELAESRNVTFKYDQPNEFPVVKLDDNKIRQVMMNMIDNAIYYTPMGGIVTIELYVDASEIVFKVIDNGIGVPKSERHKLFTKFFRASNARVARPDGTGLGLFMAQKIVLAQGGTIVFESEEGKGSTFGWRFPLSKIKP